MQTQLLIESNQGDWRENYDAFFKNGMFHDQRAEHSHPAAAAHLTQVKPISFCSGPSHSGSRICLGFRCVKVKFCAVLCLTLSEP